MAHSSWNVDPLVDGRGGRRRMRGSMDVVDAERLQRSGVAMVWLKEEILLKHIPEYHIGFTILSQ
jgi:hypothetical protein